MLSSPRARAAAGVTTDPWSVTWPWRRSGSRGVEGGARQGRQDRDALTRGDGPGGELRGLAGCGLAPVRGAELAVEAVDAVDGLGAVHGGRDVLVGVLVGGVHEVEVELGVVREAVDVVGQRVGDDVRLGAADRLVGPAHSDPVVGPELADGHVGRGTSGGAGGDVAHLVDPEGVLAVLVAGSNLDEPLDAVPLLVTGERPRDVLGDVGRAVTGQLDVDVEPGGLVLRGQRGRRRGDESRGAGATAGDCG